MQRSTAIGGWLGSRVRSDSFLQLNVVGFLLRELLLLSLWHAHIVAPALWCFHSLGAAYDFSNRIFHKQSFAS
jgi:hypothetical protein